MHIVTSDLAAARNAGQEIRISNGDGAKAQRR